MSFNLKIIGCGSALPTMSRNASAQILRHNQKPFLIDCAENTQVLLRKYSVKFAMINNIFISHLHGDHFFGIFGLISSFSMMGRKNVLNIYAHQELENMLKSQYSPVNLDELEFQINFITLDNKNVKEIYQDKHITVTSFPLKHRIDVCGFLFKEKPLPLNIKKEAITQYNLSIAQIVKIKNGEDLILDNGQIIENKLLTIEPEKPKSYAYVSDTLPQKKIIPIIENVDCLYHEATFDNSLKSRAKQTYHSTTDDAANIAKECNAKKLLIGHFSSRYTTTELLENQTRQIFENSFAVYDGMEIII